MTSWGRRPASSCGHLRAGYLIWGQSGTNWAQKAQAVAKPNFTKAADAHKKATENLDAKNAADAALAQAAEALQVADAAFEVAKQAAEATKTAVKDAETKVKETTTAQAEAKKGEAAAKTVLRHIHLAPTPPNSSPVILETIS